MKKTVSAILLYVLWANAPVLLQGQCPVPGIARHKMFSYKCREIHITDVSLNNTGSNVLHVAPDEKIHLRFNYYFTQGCTHCGECVIHLFWGIHGYYSECFTAFYGIYERSWAGNAGSVSGVFHAPDIPGVYYITPGGTEDNICRNSPERPDPFAGNAFAVLVVGNPTGTAKVTVTARGSGAGNVLHALASGRGCTGILDRFQWYRNDTLLANEKLDSIVLERAGSYKVRWYNTTGEEVSAIYLYCLRANDVSMEKASPVKTQGLEKPAGRLMISVRLTDDSTNGVLTGTVFLESEDGTRVMSLANYKNGEFLFYPQAKMNYRLHAQASAYYANDVLIRAGEFDSAAIVEKEIKMISLKKGNRIVVDNILFHQGEYQLTGVSKHQLDHLANMLQQNPGLRIRLEGHTDNRGDFQKDLKLSLDRANAVRGYLINKGIAGDRIETKGFAGTKPAYSNETEESRKRNRRVEMIIL